MAIIDNHPLFGSESKFKHYELTEIVRQAKDSPIITLATDIRNRIDNTNLLPLRDLVVTHTCDIIQLYDSGKEFMSDYFSDKDDKKWYDSDQIIGAYTNASVDNYNRAVRKKYWKDEGKELDEIEYIHVGDSLIFQEPHIVDDTVVHSNNDIVEVTYAQKEFDDNSQMWIWYLKDEDGIEFKVIDSISKKRFEDLLQLISKNAQSLKGWDRKKMWEQYYSLKEEFQVVKYTYSSTIHKLQGSTFETVYIDMREMAKFYEFQDKEFIYRLLYVAVTRASKNIKILI